MRPWEDPRGASWQWKQTSEEMYDHMQTIQRIVIAGLMVLAILFLMAMFAKLFRKAGPHEALVVYGFRGTRIVKGRGTVIFPMVESCRGLSLELMSFDVAPQQDLYTRQGVAVTVEAVAQIKVKSDPESILTAAEQFLTKPPEEREGLIRLVMEGHLRGIIGQLTVEEIVKQPEMVGDRMRSTCADDMNKMGLEVISFTIKEVRDKNEYITNMGRPDVARIKRDADVATAEAERDTAIKRAEATREAAVAKAQADQERVLAETLSQAKQAEAQRDLEIKKAEYLETRQEAAGAGRQGLRDPDQHHAAAGARRGGQDSADGERARDQGAGRRNPAPRARADRHRAEAGGGRAAAHRDAGRGREEAADRRSRRPRRRHPRAGRSRSRDHLQEGRSRSQGHEREGRGLPGIQPGGDGRQADHRTCRKWCGRWRRRWPTSTRSPSSPPATAIPPGCTRSPATSRKMAAQIPALFETLSGMQMCELFAKVRPIGDKAADKPDDKAKGASSSNKGELPWHY